MRRLEKRGIKRWWAGPVAWPDRPGLFPKIISGAHFQTLRGTDSCLSWASACRATQRRHCISVVPSPPADTPRFSGFKPSPGQASFDADPFPPHSANRVTNRHPPTLARGVQAENLHALITNVIKRYNWIAYQPVEFTNCNVAGAPYATSDPVFSLA
jgi:hypothetical protein